MPPLTRGLSTAPHLTGGEIFPFLSLRLLPAAKATSLVRGRNNGSSRTPTPTHEIEYVCPHKPQFIYSTRNGQSRLRLPILTLYFPSASSSERKRPLGYCVPKVIFTVLPQIICRPIVFGVHLFSPATIKLRQIFLFYYTHF